MHLPIDPFIPGILETLAAARAIVLTAAPGTGKTTRLGPALAREGATLLLQPRRVAARSLARYIAAQNGWTLGDEVGWQVRFERRFTARTRLLVATEGVLTARAQADPLLSGFRTIVLDEFHERSLHADLALALAKQAWLARDDLRLVVMSATMETAPVVEFLGGCPVVHVPGAAFNLDIDYAPGEALTDAVRWALAQSNGQVLCFLPGAPEIRRASAEVEAVARSAKAAVVPLHGSLPPEEQDEAIRGVDVRRVILATNIAETSVTVPGVTAVVDSGLHKVARYDAERGIDSLDLERVSQDAADQRAGRAGRTAPGVVRRLWDARDRLRPRREPEIERVDLCGLLVDVLAWGGDPSSLDWLTPPPGDRLDAAWRLLERLGAVRGRALTATGERLRRIPLHPRLARILIAAGGAREAARACALLSERYLIPPRAATTSSDLLSAIDRWSDVPWSVDRAAREIERVASEVLEETGPRATSPHVDETPFRRAIFAGYADRVARRREPNSPRLALSSGRGAVLSEESGVRNAPFLVAIDVQAGSGPDARVRIASAVEREWLEPTGTRVEHRFDRESGAVRAFAIDLYDDLVLDERPVAPDPETASRVLAEEWLARGPSPEDEQVIRRARFAGLPLDVEAAVRAAAAGVRSLGDLHLGPSLPHDVRRALDRDAPATLNVPSGRQARLTYRADGGVEAGVKLQELFGLAETPRIGPRREPVLLVLLAPSGRPVQVTRDLRNFWNTTYPEVRRELRARYPRHPWPEDPWTATPTARTKKR